MTVLSNHRKKIVWIVVGVISILVIVYCASIVFTELHVDGLYALVIRGTVYDQKTQLPLDHVALFYTPRGAENKHSAWIQKLGESDQHGQIDIQCPLAWGRDTSPIKWFVDPDLKFPFDVMLMKESYFGWRFSFHARELLGEDKMTIDVNLGDVYMETDPRE